MAIARGEQGVQCVSARGEVDGTPDYANLMGRRSVSAELRTGVSYYRPQRIPVIFYTNRATGLTVITSRTGEFISGWRLDATNCEMSPREVRCDATRFQHRHLP